MALAREILKESLFRRPLIMVSHTLCLVSIALLFLIPDQDSFHWGNVVFVCSGCFLPLFLTTGIMGDDFASGRIALLAVSSTPLFVVLAGRYLAVVFQGLANIAIAVLTVCVLHAVTPRGSLEYLGPWILATVLMFASLAALSTLLSTALSGSGNFMAMVVGLAAMLFARMYLGDADVLAASVTCSTIDLALPPLVRLLRFVHPGTSLSDAVFPTMHVAGLVLVYVFAAGTALRTMEFKCRRE